MLRGCFEAKPPTMGILATGAPSDIPGPPRKSRSREQAEYWLDEPDCKRSDGLPIMSQRRLSSEERKSPVEERTVINNTGTEARTKSEVGAQTIKIRESVPDLCCPLDAAQHMHSHLYALSSEPHRDVFPFPLRDTESDVRESRIDGHDCSRRRQQLPGC